MKNSTNVLENVFTWQNVSVSENVRPKTIILDEALKDMLSKSQFASQNGILEPELSVSRAVVKQMNDSFSYVESFVYDSFVNSEC